MQQTHPILALLTTLAPEDAAVLVDSYGASIADALLIRTLEVLPETAVDRFVTLVREGDGAAVEAFLKSEVPDIDAVLSVEVARFRDLLDTAGKVLESATAEGPSAV